MAWKPGQPLLTRALKVYSVYDVRSDPLASVRALLPEGLAVVGFMGTPMTSTSPCGGRSAPGGWNISSSAILSEQIRKRHIQYAVVDEMNLLDNHTTLPAWQQRDRGGISRHGHRDSMTVAQGPHHWYIVRFPD